jgi:hypothetical protein
MTVADGLFKAGMALIPPMVNELRFLPSFLGAGQQVRTKCGPRYRVRISGPSASRRPGMTADGIDNAAQIEEGLAAKRLI